MSVSIKTNLYNNILSDGKKVEKMGRERCVCVFLNEDTFVAMRFVFV